MAEIAELFAGLNVALAALDADAEVGRRRLMDVQARAASIATLNQAPRLVVQIVEDVLAQTAASQEGLLKPRAALVWQRDLAGACRYRAGRPLSLRGRSRRRPRHGRRHDRAGRRAGALLRRRARAAPRPQRVALALEARGAALGVPAGERDLLRAGGGGRGRRSFRRTGVGLTLTALAQRGAATVSLGGASAPVETSGEPAALAWPGPEPAAGLAIAFATAATTEQPDLGRALGAAAVPRRPAAPRPRRRPALPARRAARRDPRLPGARLRRPGESGGGAGADRRPRLPAGAVNIVSVHTATKTAPKRGFPVPLRRLQPWRAL